MRIGIVGSGRIGGVLGTLWLRAGYEVRFGSRHPEQLASLVEVAPSRASAGNAIEAAAFGEAVLLAVPVGAVPDLVPEIAPYVAGKLVLDAGNAYAGRDGDAGVAAAAHPGGSSAWLAAQLPGARVVKAFNTVNFAVLQREAHNEANLLGIPLAGDDEEAVALAAILVEDAGYRPVPIGPLRAGQRVEPGTAVYDTGMNAAQVAATLGIE